MVDDGVHRHSRQGFKAFQQAGLKGQGHQPGAGIGDPKAELARHLIGPARGSHLGNGLGPGGHDERARLDTRPVIQINGKAVGAVLDRLDAQVQRQGYARRLHFIRQHADDILGAVIAEQLAQGLLVPGDTVAIDHLDEVVLGKSLQGRQGKARILSQVGSRMDAQVGKVATPPARYADLLARSSGMVDQAYAATAFGRFDGTHHSGRAGTDNQDIQGLGFHWPDLASPAAESERDLGASAGSKGPEPRDSHRGPGRRIPRGAF